MKNNSLEKFGAAVRFEREKAGISQEALAERCGLHRTYIGGIERGERNVGLLNIIRISDALGIPPSLLIKHLDSDIKT